MELRYDILKICIRYEEHNIKDINKELHEEFNFILNDPEEYE